MDETLATADSKHNPKNGEGDASECTVPVHINVGGVIYTSSLGTLTKHADSRLARMFKGNIPIFFDIEKEQYFIDRDGRNFRHILNFIRTNTLAIPDDFKELDLLYEEAKFYDIPDMIKKLDVLRCERAKRTTEDSSSSSFRNSRDDKHCQCGCVSPFGENGVFGCLVLNTNSQDKILITGERALVEEVFPGINQPTKALPWVISASSIFSRNQDSNHVTRFPLNVHCDLNLPEIITRLLNKGFRIMECKDGGVENHQYLFVRRNHTVN